MKYYIWVLSSLSSCCLAEAKELRSILAVTRDYTLLDRNFRCCVWKLLQPVAYSLRVTAPNAVPLGPLWTSTSAPVVPSTTYFSVFSFSFFLILLSTGISTSISTALVCFLSNTDICSWFASSCLCVWN